MIALKFPQGCSIGSNDSKKYKNIVYIPEKGELKDFSKYLVKDFDDNSLPVKSEIIADAKYPAVELILKRLLYHDIEKKLILPWIEARQEWIGIIYRKWRESEELYESYYGPYKINEHCLNKILQAYSLSSLNAPISKARSMGPADLERLCRVNLR